MSKEQLVYDPARKEFCPKDRFLLSSEEAELSLAPSALPKADSGNRKRLRVSRDKAPSGEGAQAPLVNTMSAPASKRVKVVKTRTKNHRSQFILWICIGFMLCFWVAVVVFSFIGFGQKNAPDSTSVKPNKTEFPLPRS